MDFPKHFIISDGINPCIEQTITNVRELDELLSDSYPSKTIVERVTNKDNKVPLIIYISAKIRENQSINPQFLDDCFNELGAKDRRLEKSPNTRITYKWDLKTNDFQLHVICPGVFEKLSEQLTKRASLSLRVLKRICVGANHYTGVTTKGTKPFFEVPYHFHDFSITVREVVPDRFFGKTGEEEDSEIIDSLRDVYGEQPKKPIRQHYILSTAPKDAQIKFFMDMLGDWEPHSDLFTDVAYSECGLGTDDSLAYKLVSRPSRPDGTRRTVRALRWLMCRIMPAKYTEWMLDQYRNIASVFMKKTVHITDEAFHQMFSLYAEHNFLAIQDGLSVKTPPSIYTFRNYWRKDLGGKEISECYNKWLTVFLPSHFKPYMTELKEYDLYEFIMDEIQKITYRHKQREDFIDATCKILIEDITLDTNPRLVACENVVIELTDTHAFTRPGKPDDLVSLSTRLQYKQYSQDESSEFHQWMNKLFVDIELRDFMYRSFSSLLYGGCPEKAFQIWFGIANNGKSRLLDGIERALGEYYGRFNCSSMNETKDGKANSEMDQLGGKRVASSSEIQPGTQMDSSVIKALTGGDAIMTRALYKNSRKMDPMFHVIIACNFVPTFKGADKAMRNRVALIPYDSIFDDDAPDDIDEQIRTKHFKADKQFKEKLSKIAPVLLHQMVIGYKNYKEKGLQDYPECVTSLCESYWNDANYYKRFVDESMVFSSDSVCRFDEVYSRFCVWLAMKQLQNISRDVAKGLLENELMTNKVNRVHIRPDKWEGCRLRA